MIIDFEKINEESVMNFKGGEGQLDTRNFVDSANKIMMSRLDVYKRQAPHREGHARRAAHARQPVCWLAPASAVKAS